MKKWIIAGSRNMNDVSYVVEELDRYAEVHGYPDVVVSGCANGADRCGETWAMLHNISIRKFPADWERHGRAAGPIRNAQMADYAKDDGMLFLFWDGKSAGSKSMLKEASNRSLRVKQYVVPEKCGG